MPVDKWAAPHVRHLVGLVGLSFFIYCRAVSGLVVSSSLFQFMPFKEPNNFVQRGQYLRSILRTNVSPRVPGPNLRTAQTSVESGQHSFQIGQAQFVLPNKIERRFVREFVWRVELHFCNLFLSGAKRTELLSSDYFTQGLCDSSRPSSR